MFDEDSALHSLSQASQSTPFWQYLVHTRHELLGIRHTFKAFDLIWLLAQFSRIQLNTYVL